MTQKKYKQLIQNCENLIEQLKVSYYEVNSLSEKESIINLINEQINHISIYTYEYYTLYNSK